METTEHDYADKDWLLEPTPGPVRFMDNAALFVAGLLLLGLAAAVFAL